MNAIENNEFSTNWRILGQRLPAPKAIVVVSAHWQTEGLTVTTSDQPETVHDFWGFPEILNRFVYPAPGAPVLAETIKHQLTMAKVRSDPDRGLDHGTWSVLAHLFPAASVPVIQISLDWRQSPGFHYQLGQDLGFLRQQGVLLVGSGNVVHNLDLIADQQKGFDWADQFALVVKKALEKEDHQALIDYEHLHPAAHLAVPTNEHYLPMLFILGATQPGDQRILFSDRCTMGSLSMLSFLYYQEAG